MPMLTHLHAAERGLPGTSRELLQCLEEIWWDLYLPHFPPVPTLPFFQLQLSSAEPCLQRGTSETRGLAASACQSPVRWV